METTEERVEPVYLQTHHDVGIVRMVRPDANEQLSRMRTSNRTISDINLFKSEIDGAQKAVDAFPFESDKTPTRIDPENGHNMFPESVIVSMVGSDRSD
eukprot:gene22120-8693_t